LTARVVKKSSDRTKSDSSVRRITKADNRFADYSSLKAATGIVIPEVKKVMLDRRKEEQSHRRTIMYPSEMSLSDWCQRATYYRMSGLPEPPSKYSFSLENVFAQGNAVHDKWQSWLAQTGKLWGDWRCSRCAEIVTNSLKPADFSTGSCVGSGWVKLTSPVNVSHGVTKDLTTDFSHDWRYREVTLKSTSLPLSGHADGGLATHNVLVELKSISAGSFRYSAPKLYENHLYDVSGKKIVDTEGMWKDFHSPLTSHLKQGNLYLFMAKEMNLPFDRISFVYENKANNQAKEFIVPYSFEIIENILEQASLVTECLSKGTPPPCPKGGCASCRAYEGGK
jgi:hypothetical protein